MNKRILTAGLLVLGSAVVVVLASGWHTGFQSPPAALAAHHGDATVSDVMVVVNGRDGILGQLQQASKEGISSEKQWKVVKAKAAIVASLANNVLVKASPKKGEAGSWKKHAGAFAANAKKVAEGAASKKEDAVAEGLAALKKSCGGCHKAHK